MIDSRNPRYDRRPDIRACGAWKYAGEPAQAPVVTIITPFFNAGTVFRETVRCVLQQSLQTWIWLIVDDASTDAESQRVLDEVGQADPRIQVLRAPANGGPGYARNLGIAAAQTPYIFQLDSDDLMEPVTLEVLTWYLHVNPDCWFAKGYEVGFGAQQYLWARGFDDREQFLTENCVQTNAIVRRALFAAVGGYDETIRGGCEDWEFWLRCADRGLWGKTVPLYMHWYRRREDHSLRWANFDSGPNYRRFRQHLAAKFPNLTKETFPKVPEIWHAPREVPATGAPTANRLTRGRRRLLLVVPHLELGGSDKFNLDLIAALQRTHDYEISVVTTLPGAQHSWLSEFYALTPDVFPLNRFLRVPDYPRFLSYLIHSRDYDAVMVTHSAFGYQLLPYLRSQFPLKAFVDYVHIEELNWKGGGYPRMSVDYCPDLDASLASSRHLRSWMIERGHEERKCRVVYTNVDTDYWSRGRARQGRAATRGDHDGRIKVAFIGRLHEQKRPRVLAAIALRLKRAGWGGRIFVAGAGPEEEWLRQFVKQNLLNNVEMLGSVSNEKVRDLLCCCHLLLVPSENEGIALVAYEAMSMEVVPVMADVGGQRELVTPETGILIGAGEGEEEAYVEAILRLSSDAKLRAELAKQARARVVENFGIERLAHNVHQCLLEAEGEARRRVGPAVDERLARTIAKEAVEQVRLEALSEWLWTQRSGAVNAIKERTIAAVDTLERIGWGGAWTSSIRRKVRWGWRS